MIKNLVFDAGGVLLDLDREAAIKEFIAIGYPQAEALLDPYKQAGIFLKLEEGKITPEQLYTYIQEQAECQITKEQIDNALFQFITGLQEYKLSLLLELRKSHNVYLLSNTNAIMVPYIYEKYFTQQGLTVDSYFDRIFLSYEMGCMKPDPKIFTEMMTEAGIIAQESLMIDDSPANIKTASELGMQTVLITPDYDLRKIIKML